ncbi:helix-turn-helix domain-containing protein [Aneurinibacillus terranovensis]|uniref:helix-turn-helix domain-containing protein n=1 Tax=Aneurinibacillus terranovensis TaxID=278991 RepID=UPI00068786B1|nr:RodZ domain-containing protein [Aneurinibacillus terranovensis]
MSELGEVLRRARQEKGMTLYDIQEKTKIQTRYLEAIESGNFDVLPGHFYARAFLKSYAETVGLDAETLIAEHAAELPAPPVQVEQPTPLRQSRQPRKEGSGSKWVSRTMLYLFAILILAVIYFAITSLSSKQKEPAQPGANPPSVTTQPSDIVIPPPPKPAPAKPAAPAPAAPAPAAATLTPGTVQGSTANFDLTGLAPTDKISVSVKATSGNHWMSISDANGQIEQLTLTEGQSKTWDVTGNMVYLRIYHAQNTQVTVNGQTVTIPDSKYKTQKIRITRK